ncbi:hypothetical protein [Halovivax gelatinilyticus]|uniref:hypothetical protein n=1 Tax=Halovivax gelatinilyticus TaxID=2961597 RepID=UPI0020CA2C68|nr:hypothetical protein [Halovivax gelatinilyticus]
MNTDVDRERGMLSPADRAYLLGEREMGHDQSKRNAESRIRRRVRHALLDWNLLLHTLPTKDRRRLFEEIQDDPALLDGLRAAVAFGYIGVTERGMDFETVLEPAVRSSEEARAAKNEDASVSVEVNFDVETTVESTLATVAERIDAGRAVTPRELFSLIMQDVHEVTGYEEIDLVRTDEGADDDFLERLADYLGGTLLVRSSSRATIRLDAASE